jgi:alkylation response protein AidB-like acyl-CoA dehydrogenase
VAAAAVALAAAQRGGAGPAADQLGTVLDARIVVHPLLCHAANEALQVLGGLGYTREAGIEKIVRDNNHMRLMCGAPDELRLIVAAIDRHTSGEDA